MLTGAAREALLEIAPCGIATISDNGDVIYANNYLCNLVGFFKEELEGKPVENIFTISTRIFYQTHFYPLIKLHKKAEEIFFSLKGRDNESIPVIAYASVTGNNICCVFVPAKQRKKYEEEILQAKKLAEDAVHKNEYLVKLKQEAELQLAESERQLSQLRQFNSEYVELNRIISHDLHEPVRRLMIHIDLLLESKDPDQAKLESHLQKMMRSGERLRELTMCLQQYVAIDTSKEKLSSIDLEATFKSLVENFKAQHADVPVNVHVDQLPSIQGYPSQVERLLAEIIKNCYQFRNPDAILEINVRSTELSHNIYKQVKGKYNYVDFVRLDIEDNGIGFPGQYGNQVFGLFKQLHVDKGGSGFGLALCKKIVERHQGEIYANSKNHKTTISVMLPLKQPFSIGV
jgi:sigma-B regulation protein RsbU (phosphoserine phosphatase)